MSSATVRVQVEASALQLSHQKADDSIETFKKRSSPQHGTGTGTGTGTAPAAVFLARRTGCARVGIGMRLGWADQVSGLAWLRTTIDGMPHVWHVYTLCGVWCVPP